MWKCHKCGKPVYFAERKQSLGYDWHPECLRCEECGKRLNPGLHAEHKGVPYCHVPCYGALFGPQLFGHGTRVESHKSFGDKQAAATTAAAAHQRGGGALAGPALPRDHIESKLRVYNAYYNNGSHEVRCREVNERLVLEGALRVCWGIQGMIHLKEDDDQRTVITVRKRNSCRYNLSGDADQQQEHQEQHDDEHDARNDDGYYHDPEPADEAALDLNGIDAPTDADDDDFNTATYVKQVHSAAIGGGSDSTDISLTESMSYDTCAGVPDDHTSAGSSANGSPEHQQPPAQQSRSRTLPGKIEEIAQLQWDELDDLLQVERKLDDATKPYQTMPSSASSSLASTTADDSSRTLTRDFERCLDLSEEDSTTTTATNANSSSCGSGSSTTTTTTSTSTATTSTSSEEYVTPCSTLKNVDFDLFRQQMNEEYRTNTQQLQSLGEGTLRSNQPIDPSRINDSLKLYSEQQQQHHHNNQLMSKSFCGAEPALRTCAPTVPYQTLRAARNGIGAHFVLQKSGSAVVAALPSREIAADPEGWQQRGLNRSRSGPNWFEANNGSDSEATLKPSTIRKQQQQQQELYTIRMDCYEDAQRDEDQPGSTAATIASSHTSFDVSSSTAVTSSGCLENGTSSSAMTTPTTETSCTFASSGGGSGSETSSSQTTSTPTATNYNDEEGVVLRRPKHGSTAIKRRSGNKRLRAKLKRRCSINGHFYNRETSFFTPPHGSQMSVWVTSLVSTADVIQLLLEKYKVDSRPANFALYVVRDNGEQKRLRDDEYPLVTRIMMGPHEEVARLFLMDAQSTTEISSDMAQYLNLSLPETRSIIDRFTVEQEREAQKIRDKYAELKSRIVQRMDSLKVRL